MPASGASPFAGVAVGCGRGGRDPIDAARFAECEAPAFKRGAEARNDNGGRFHESQDSNHVPVKGGSMRFEVCDRSYESHSAHRPVSSSNSPSILHSKLSLHEEKNVDRYQHRQKDAENDRDQDVIAIRTVR